MTADRRQFLDAVLRKTRDEIGVEDRHEIILPLAVAATVDLEGPPLWVMTVGPPSSGKTERAKLLRDVEHEWVGELTVAGLLHEQTIGKKSVPAGVLKRIGERGLIIVPEFSTVLGDADRNHRSQLFAKLREVHDGRTQRDIRSAIPLKWEGRVTLFACCTSIIDHYASYGDALGPRFLTLRVAPMSREEQRERMRRDVQGITPELRTLVAKLVMLGREQIDLIVVSDDAQNHLLDAAEVLALGRTSVPRDGYRGHVEGLAETEHPHRIRQQLELVVRGAMAVGLDELEAVEMAYRMALDSMPAARLHVLGLVVHAGDPLTANETAKCLNTSWAVTRRVLEDLSYAGVLTYTTTQQPTGKTEYWYRLDESWRAVMKRVFAGHPSRYVWERYVLSVDKGNKGSVFSHTSRDASPAGLLSETTASGRESG
jgi:hypothetical protein